MQPHIDVIVTRMALGFAQGPVSTAMRLMNDLAFSLLTSNEVAPLALLDVSNYIAEVVDENSNCFIIVF